MLEYLYNRRWPGGRQGAGVRGGWGGQRGCNGWGGRGSRGCEFTNLIEFIGSKNNNNYTNVLLTGFTNVSWQKVEFDRGLISGQQIQGSKGERPG